MAPQTSGRHTMVDLRGVVPVHATENEGDKDSWLGRAINPLQRLMRFHNDQRRRQEDEDRRLASLAAAIVVQPQPRVFPPNNMTVAVVGCGRMGCDITGELLRRGCTVRVYDQTEYARERALQLIAATIQKHTELGRQLPHDEYYLLERFTVHNSIDEVVRGATLVIEAIIEDLPAKVNVLKKIATALANQNVPPGEVLLASNTVSIPMNQLVDGLAQHDPALPYVTRFVGMRFLDPTWYIDNVELTLPVVEMEPPSTSRSGSHKPNAPALRFFFTGGPNAQGRAPIVRFFFTGGPFAQHLTLEETTAMYETWSRVQCTPESTEAAVRTDQFVRFLGFKPTYFVGDARRHMTYEEAALYATRQRQQCESDGANLLSGAADPRWPAGLAPVAPAPPPTRGGDEAELCAICMTNPRDTLLRPCGHVATCLTCAQSMLQRTAKPACVVCRAPIEDLLPVPNLAALPQSALPPFSAARAGEAQEDMRSDSVQEDSRDDTSGDTQSDSQDDGAGEGFFEEMTDHMPLPPQPPVAHQLWAAA